MPGPKNAFASAGVDKADRAVKGDKLETIEKSDRADKPEKAEKAEKADKAERTEKSDKASILAELEAKSAQALQEAKLARERLESKEKVDKAEKAAKDDRVETKPKRVLSTLEAVEELESFVSKGSRRMDTVVNHSGALVLKEAPDAQDRLRGRSPRRSRSRSRGTNSKPLRKASRSRSRSRSRSYGTWGQRPIHPRFGKGYGKFGGKGYVSPRPNISRGIAGVSRVHVSGLAKGSTERDVKKIFSDYGEVLGLHMLGSRGGTASAIIRYSKPHAAETAIIALNGKYDIQLAKPNPRWDTPGN